MGLRCWSRTQLRLLRGAALLLAALCVVCLVRLEDSRLDSAPLCRADMELNVLPPMADNDDAMLKDLFTYITQPSRKACGKVLKFGGIPSTQSRYRGRILNRTFEDGHKYACVDREFSLATADACLVYSFGISVDWSFDWDMEAFGCTVFAFDPSINTTTGSQNGTIMFLQYGIAGRDVSDVAHGWQLRTLDTFVERLKHTEHTIHYLKLDTEGAEWEVLRQQTDRGRDSVLWKNVQQMGVELHFGEHRPVRQHVPFYREVYQSFLRLQQMGFYLFSYEPNFSQVADMPVPGISGDLTDAMEVVWVKTGCVRDAAAGRPEAASVAGLPD